MSKAAKAGLGTPWSRHHLSQSVIAHSDEEGGIYLGLPHAPAAPVPLIPDPQPPQCPIPAPPSHTGAPHSLALRGELRDRGGWKLPLREVCPGSFGKKFASDGNSPAIKRTPQHRQVRGAGGWSGMRAGMAETQLAMLSLLLLLFLQVRAASLGGTRGCLGDTECCELWELARAEARLSKGSPSERHRCPQHQTPHQGEKRAECQGQSHGPRNSRAAAPWRYREDCDSTRFPRLLLQAECLCPHCVSLDPPHRRDRRGNSVRVNANTTVYYRRQCPGRPDAYYLEPQLYEVAVACICVVPQS